MFVIHLLLRSEHVQLPLSSAPAGQPSRPASPHSNPPRVRPQRSRPFGGAVFNIRVTIVLVKAVSRTHTNTLGSQSFTWRIVRDLSLLWSVSMIFTIMLWSSVCVESVSLSREACESAVCRVGSPQLGPAIAALATFDRPPLLLCVCTVSCFARLGGTSIVTAENRFCVGIVCLEAGRLDWKVWGCSIDWGHTPLTRDVWTTPGTCQVAMLQLDEACCNSVRGSGDRETVAACYLWNCFSLLLPSSTGSDLPFSHPFSCSISLTWNNSFKHLLSNEAVPSRIRSSDFEWNAGHAPKWILGPMPSSSLFWVV